MANVAEEVKKPKKTLPRAIILSVLITVIIYILVSLSSARILNWEELSQSAAPLADIAAKDLGFGGSITLTAIALFATASTVLITLVAGARILYGMAKGGSLPSILGKVHSKTGTPWIAIIGIFATSVVFAFVGDIAVVANIVVFAVIITFAMINLSVILLRYVKPNDERPFKVPLNIGKFPIMPFIGFAVTVYMVSQFELEIITDSRPGLLNMISGEINQLSLEIDKARINTLGNRAEDFFLITSKKVEEATIKQLKKNILERLT